MSAPDDGSQVSAMTAFAKISVVIPVFHGSATVAPLVAAVRQHLRGRAGVEIVLVNDGSTEDDSAEVCAGLAAKDPGVRFVDLSRNFGEHNAVMAGLRHCSGDAAAIIDDDFQNPPSEIARLLDKLAEGYDVVYSRYPQKQHSWFRNLGSRFNNLVGSLMIPKPLGLYLSSFKALNRFLIDEIIRYDGPYPYIDGLILRVTRRYATVEVQHVPRREGKSGYTVRKLVSLWLNMFTSFSILPLRIATVLGFLFSALGLVLGTVFLIERFRDPTLPAGWTSIIVSLFIVSGVQLFAIGMVGEYVGRLFLNASRKPQYVVRRTVNVEPVRDIDG